MGIFKKCFPQISQISQRMIIAIRDILWQKIDQNKSPATLAGQEIEYPGS